MRAPEPGPVGHQVEGEQQDREELEHHAERAEAEPEGVAGQLGGEGADRAVGVVELLGDLVAGQVRAEGAVDPVLDALGLVRRLVDELRHLVDDELADGAEEQRPCATNSTTSTSPVAEPRRQPRWASQSTAGSSANDRNSETTSIRIRLAQPAQQPLPGEQQDHAAEEHQPCARGNHGGIVGPTCRGSATGSSAGSAPGRSGRPCANGAMPARVGGGCLRGRRQRI